MRRLYLFCIGGTGVRVLKSLVFLMASGVDVKADEIIPIIIDPDKSNGDVTRTVNIMKQYDTIRDVLKKNGFKNSKFFQREMKTLAKVEAESAKDGERLREEDNTYRFNIDGTAEGKFRDFINFNQLDEIDQLLVNGLYKNAELNQDLNVGFKGKPHMGTIVLNKFSESIDFTTFSNLIEENDRVFIISSIFGGTGAAGFPLLVKNLRKPPQRTNVQKIEHLKNAKVGAVTVLPYFNVTVNNDSEIDSSTFMNKAKAALEYYYRNISDNNELNALYYIGDLSKGTYENNEGESAQRNKAHLIEFLSALSVVDFLENDEAIEGSENGRAKNPIYKEYGLVGGDERNVNFMHLDPFVRKNIAKRMIQFTYMIQFVNKHMDLSKNDTYTKVFHEKSIVDTAFFKHYLKKFNNSYLSWLREMSENMRKFYPLKWNLESDYYHTQVNGVEQKKTGLFSKSSNWDDRNYVDYLNKAVKKIDSGHSIENQFMDLFEFATDEIFNDRIAKSFK